MKSFVYVLLLLLLLSVTLSSAQMTSPAPGTTWKVNQHVYVSFTQGKPGETVDIFFNNNRSGSLGGGPISGGDTTFEITVPIRALSPPYGTSDLLAVHRINRNLTYVDNVPIHVIW